MCQSIQPIRGRCIYCCGRNHNLIIKKHKTNNTHRDYLIHSQTTPYHPNIVESQQCVAARIAPHAFTRALRASKITFSQRPHRASSHSHHTKSRLPRRHICCADTSFGGGIFRGGCILACVSCLCMFWMWIYNRKKQGWPRGYMDDIIFGQIKWRVVWLFVYWKNVDVFGVCLYHWLFASDGIFVLSLCGTRFFGAFGMWFLFRGLISRRDMG